MDATTTGRLSGSTAETVRVTAGETVYEGVTTLLTEHNLTVFLDEAEALQIGASVEAKSFGGTCPSK